MKKAIKHTLNFSLVAFAVYMMIETCISFAKTSQRLADMRSRGIDGMEYALAESEYAIILIIDVFLFVVALSIYFNLRYFLLSQNKKAALTAFNIILFAVSALLILCTAFFGALSTVSLKLPQLIITFLFVALLLLRFVYLLVAIKE